MIWLFASGGQSIATSASVLPMSSQCWFPLGLTGLISLQFKGFKSILQHHSSKTSFFCFQPSVWFRSHIHARLLGKTIPWVYGPLPAKWCLWLHMLYRLVITFLPRSKCLLTSWLQSQCSGFGTHKNKNLSQFPLCPDLFAVKYFDHLMRRVDSLENTLLLVGIEVRRRSGRRRMKWLDGITD